MTGIYENQAAEPSAAELARRRDWRGLIRCGAVFFMLEKLGAAVGVSNLHIYAAMRGHECRAGFHERCASAVDGLYEAGQS